MANAVNARHELPTLTFVEGKPLSQVVAEVISNIQKLMMDDMIHNNRPGTIPNMPREFLCSEVVDKKKQEMLDIAGEDKREYPLQCYEIIVPLLMGRPPMLREVPSHYIWSGNIVSIDKIPASELDLAVVNVRGVFAREKSSSSVRKPVKKYIPISSTDVKDIPSKALRNFLQSPLVCKQPSGIILVSSYQMTISWLRSRLDKALNKYRQQEKDVEVIATIKQKDGGPLFLLLQVEKKRPRRSEMTSYDFLFMFCPAFRVSRCQLLVPVLIKLDKDTLPPTYKSWSKHCMWKKITKCNDTSRDHKHNVFTTKSDFVGSSLPRTPSEAKNVTPTTRESDEKAIYKSSIDKFREITPFERRRCEQCTDPASRMLLEYYYQYSHIPEDEMNRATSFVWEILMFLKRSIEEDQKHNEPKIVKFVESGSVSEKLKVIQPDEFDIMINIDLPDSTECYTFLEDQSFPTGYAICKVRRSKSFSRGLKRCFHETESDEFSHCLAPENLAFGWLYSKLELAINKYKNLPARHADLKVRQSGPALLLEISPTTTPHTPKLPRKISVDLVLALRLSDDDSRYAVAKRAKEEQFYKKVVNERRTAPGEDGLARKNLKYLWRISYSFQEKRYLEHVREVQLQARGVEGCQDICLMILKTVCTREILKREQSVICHKLSSYILKTALFHVLAQSDLVRDWTMDCLADRYVDLLNRLSKWQELPHFFFNNESNLRKVFPEDHWCGETKPKNLLDELHATLKIQLLKRFGHISSTFIECKKRMDGIRRSSDRRFDYRSFLTAVLGGRTPEQVIHPPFSESVKPDEESKKSLVEKVSEDRKVGKAAKAERKGGPRSNQERNLERPAEDEVKSKERHEKAAQKKANRGLVGFPVYDPYDALDDGFDCFNLNEPDLCNDDSYDPCDYLDNLDDGHEIPECWGYWND